MIEVPDRRVPRSVHALGYRDYRLFWTTSVVSNTGSMMYLAAIGWLVEDITDDPLKVTVAATAGLIPLLVMSPFGGSLADRFSRTRLFLATVIGQMVVAVALAWVVQIDAETFWVLVSVGLAFMTTMTTLTSALQSLCDDAYRGRVMSLWMMLFGLAAPVSILLEGLLASSIGIRWVLAITALLQAVYLTWQHARRRLRHLDAAE